MEADWSSSRVAGSVDMGAECVGSQQARGQTVKDLKVSSYGGHACVHPSAARHYVKGGTFPGAQ